jgi:hypothetical protein
MNNAKTFTITYYVAFLLSLIIAIYTYNVYNEYDMYTPASPMVYLGIINLFLVIVFTIIILTKKKTLNGNSIIPFGYVVFEAIVFIVCVMYNKILINENMQLGYFCTIILGAYILLNIYALLSFEGNNKKTKRTKK